MPVPRRSPAVDIGFMVDRPSDSRCLGFARRISGRPGGAAAPAGPSLASRQHETPTDAGVPAHLAASSTPSSGSTGESKVYPFDAEAGDRRDRPREGGRALDARARTLSTSTLSMSSRRMCYVDRRVIVAVHRMDNKPMMLLGRVADCRYDTDGLYTIDLELLPTDDADVKVSFSRKAM